MGEIRRPPLLRNASLSEINRVVKHGFDNLDRVHRRVQVLELQDVQHGVELLVPSTWTTLPQAIPGGQATNGLRVSSVKYRIVDEEAGGRSGLGVTVYFEPPFGAVTVCRTTNQSISTASLTSMQWESTEYTEGPSATWSSGANTRITFASAGRVRLDYQAMFGVTGGIAYVLLNGTGAHYAKCAADGTYAGLNGSDELTVAANDYAELKVYQASGGAADILAAGNERAAMTARYVAPSSSATADVTLLLICD